MKWKESFHPYAITTIVLWSLAYVMTRIALRSFSAFSLGFLRYFTASCTLILFALATKMKLPYRKDFKWFLAAGALGFFLYMIFFNKGCETITASTSSVIIATVPVLTTLAARFFQDEKLNRLQWTAIFFEFAGVVVLSLLHGEVNLDVGILWLILAAISLSLYNLLQRRLTKTYTALQITAFSIFIGTIMLGIFSPEAVVEWKNTSTEGMAAVLILGVFSSAAAYAAWSKAFAKADNTSSVSNYMFATPFLASLLGFLLAGEIPDLSTIAGGTLILIGMGVFHFGGAGKQN